MSMASIFALVFSFPYQLGVEVTSRASSVFVGLSLQANVLLVMSWLLTRTLVGASLGAMLVPMAAGFIFQTLGASLLMWIILSGNLMLVLCYFILSVCLPRVLGITVISSHAEHTKDSSGDSDALL